MRAYKSGDRTGTIMNRIAKGFSEAEIDAMARYFAQSSPPRARHHEQ
jgi:sulfide dehydrogenase cytochrome subunit